MKKILLHIVFVLGMSVSWSQVEIQFVKPDTSQVDFNGAACEVSTLSYYMSHLTFYKNKEVLFESDSIFLIDHLKNMHKMISIPTQLVYDSISFQIGIDSTTSVSGVMGGDLDPLTGMYWTWQSGYIHFKLELENKQTKTTPVSMHLGGYADALACYAHVGLATQSRKMWVYFDLNKLLSSLPKNEKVEVMSPSSRAVAYMRLIPNCLVIALK